VSSDIPEWVHTACRRWGRQKRRIWTGKDWYIDSAGIRRYDVDGYASSLLGRIRDERDGAGQSQIKQHWPEVLWGDGLEVQRAIIGMPEAALGVGHLNFVFDPEFGLTATKKAELLEISLRKFWDELKTFEMWVFARLYCAHDQVREIPEENHEKGLQQVKKEVRNSVTLITSPKYPLSELNLSALKRKKLSLVS
jgi:hypothetical protein